MKIILSCTTTKERVEIFYYCLQSLFKQTFQPDIFLINISKTAYLSDSGFSMLPAWFEDKRLTINWVENIGSYRKLLPALDYANENDIIVTCDDDVIYHPSWLSKLVKAHKNNPNSVIAGRARLIKKNIFGNYLNYSKWIPINEISNRIDLLPVGIDGVLYKKSFLNLNFIHNRIFLKIAPKTDDLWFKSASYLNKTKVFYSPECAQGNVYLLHNMGLQEDNFSKSNKTIGYLKRIIKEAVRHLYDYLGVNLTNNDIAWDKINNYVEQEYKK